jgi:hypothetical protein
MPLAALWPSLAYGQLIVPPPVAAGDAVERQRSQVRELVQGPACRPDTLEEPDTIVVCGQGIDQSTGGRSTYVPERNQYVAPENGGSWFEVKLGPASLTCCSVATPNGGSGVGLNLGIRF